MTSSSDAMSSDRPAHGSLRSSPVRPAPSSPTRWSPHATLLAASLTAAGIRSTTIVVPPARARSPMPCSTGLRRASSPRTSSAATSSWRSAAASSATSPASPPRSSAAACASCRCRPRCSRRSIPPSAARPASIPARQEPGRRLSPAEPRPRRHRAARHPAPARMRAGYAEVVKYGLIDDAAVLFLVRGELARRLRGRDRRATRRWRTSLPAKAALRRARRARGGRPRAAQSRPHLRPRPRAGDAATTAPARPRRGRRDRACPRLPFSARLGLCLRRRTPARVEGHLRTVGLPTRLARVPGLGRGSVDALLDAMARTRRSRRGALTFILARGIGQSFIAPRISIAARCAPSSRDSRADCPTAWTTIRPI